MTFEMPIWNFILNSFSQARLMCVESNGLETYWAQPQ